MLSSVIKTRACEATKNQFCRLTKILQEMDKHPKLEVKIDKKLEKQSFTSFIKDNNYTTKKIFNSYPLLKKQMENRVAIEQFVDNFINNLYKKYEKDIQTIVKKESTVLSKVNNEIFSGITLVMNYKFKKEFVYKAIPTFLPFSPTGNDFFQFSLYKQLIEKENSKRRVDRIAIHELTHVVWYKLVPCIYKKLNLKLNNAANYYLKESIAVIVCENKVFNNINGGFSPQNKDLSLLKVKQNDAELCFVDYAKNIYNQSENFNDFLTTIIKKVYAIQNKLENKQDIWNKYGFSEEELTKLCFYKAVII